MKQEKVETTNEQHSTLSRRFNESKFYAMNLEDYSKLQKSFYIEYQIIKCLLRSLKKQGFPKLSQHIRQMFLKLYRGLSPEIAKLHLFQFLNYGLWNDETIPMEARDQTKFFKIISEWILSYELQVGKLQNSIKKQIGFLRQFFNKETKTMFEKIILFNEISEDLFELIEPVFWVLDKEEEKPQSDPANYQILTEDVQETIKFMSDLVFYHTIFIDGNGPYMNSVLSQILPFSQKYKNFMLNALHFSLQSSELSQRDKKQETKNGYHSLLQNSQQTQLTRITLTFLQRPDLTSQQTIDIIKLLMMHTSKAVRFAMIIDYVKFYDYLQRIKNDEVLEALQEIMYFRELIIGRTQIDEAGLIVHTLGIPLQRLNVSARSRQRIYFSQQSEYGQYSILQIEVLIQVGDISLILWKIQEGREEQIWKETKSEDRRIDILLKQVGLYALQFNNMYSWIKAKNISYKVEQYGFFCDE